MSHEMPKENRASASKRRVEEGNTCNMEKMGTMIMKSNMR